MLTSFTTAQDLDQNYAAGFFTTSYYPNCDNSLTESEIFQNDCSNIVFPFPKYFLYTGPFCELATFDVYDEPGCQGSIVLTDSISLDDTDENCRSFRDGQDGRPSWKDEELRIGSIRCSCLQKETITGG